MFGIQKAFNYAKSMFQPAEPKSLWTRSFDAKAGGKLIQRYHLKENENGSITLKRDIIGVETAYIPTQIGYPRSSLIGSIPFTKESLINTETIAANSSQSQIIDYLDKHLSSSTIGDANLAAYEKWKEQVKASWQQSVANNFHI